MTLVGSATVGAIRPWEVLAGCCLCVTVVISAVVLTVVLVRRNKRSR
ncbi:hypothetical protein [Dactylosporangium darangshiense]